MALINCPECNREISAKAESCPHCGFIIKQKQKNLSKLQVLILTSIIILIIILFTAIYYYNAIYKKSPEIQLKGLAKKAINEYIEEYW